jgi:hypothetical protein
MMLLDESGYILYPRASQTQQVPAYDFQVSIPGWHSSVLNLLLSLRAARSTQQFIDADRHRGIRRTSGLPTTISAANCIHKLHVRIKAPLIWLFVDRAAEQ